MKNKLFSIFTALAMVLGILVSPFTSANAAEAVKKEDVVGKIETTDLQDGKPDATNLTIHKLVADGYNEGVPVDHNGGVLDNTKLQKLGTNVKGLPGVKFTIYKIDKAEDFAAIKDAKPKTKEAMQEYVTQNKAALATATGLTNGETQATEGEDGAVSVSLPDGNYWVIESDRPSRVNSSLAVPFAITLPLMNQVKVGDAEAGTKYMKNVHVYPKNTEKKPEMDKSFGKLDQNDEKLKDVDSAEYAKMLKEWKDEYGPQVDQYTRDKKTIDARVGSKVPYEVKTSLKAGQKYKVLSWSDVMTSGLKYNKDVTLTYKGAGTNNEEVTVDLKNAKTESDFGFDITVNDDTVIKNINTALEKGDVEFTLKYTATLTNDAVVDLPESNNITFTPSEPKHKNDKEGVNPENKELKVTKTWAEGEVPAKALVTYILYEGDTPIASVTLKDKAIQSKSLPEDVTVDIEAETYNVTFKGLDDNKKYKVEEFADGYDPTYTAGNAVTNNVNPDRITPTPPYVVTYGKKFVKTDDNKENPTRLAGAEFKVKNGNGTDAKYLVAKTDAKVAAEQEAVKTAKAALDKAVETYNNLEADKQTDDEREKVTTAQDAYNKAVKAAGNVYEWGDKEKAIALVSDGQGQFEITGLAEGTYYLEETKAPKGFAKLTSDQMFKVDKDSYKSNGDINYKKEETTKQDAQQVINKNLTIPQTGGIGSLIFVVAGLAIMAGAYAAYRKSQARA
ncbi:MAG: pilin N-terminal domain-containing protein [Anaerococcus prevotii]|uniref:pilin N-terminal domain-containing protein n=1 Tax=Anaerococcus prevotii TaxID=33034 RepID=UPI0029042D2F|nr:pilin N-terminal domain-containing protein [Anaerococcus prevotii]MDU2558560.1 pilin N-terminal domain-containing protein [Anaerococcus prevotii]